MGACPDHEISAPPPKLKKLRKKEEAAKAIDSPKMIWMRRRNPPAVSPNASVRPVTMMMITATILATGPWRSEEHTSELQSLMRISYAVFCLKKKKHKTEPTHTQNTERPMSRLEHMRSLTIRNTTTHK